MRKHVRSEGGSEQRSDALLRRERKRLREHGCVAQPRRISVEAQLLQEGVDIRTRASSPCVDACEDMPKGYTRRQPILRPMRCQPLGELCIVRLFTRFSVFREEFELLSHAPADDRVVRIETQRDGLAIVDL